MIYLFLAYKRYERRCIGPYDPDEELLAIRRGVAHLREISRTEGGSVYRVLADDQVSAVRQLRRRLNGH